jgi:hypothetical protein
MFFTMTEKNQLTEMLVAAATLLGIDRAIQILESERSVVKSALHGVRGAVQRMTVGDLAHAVREPVTERAKPVRRRRPSHRVKRAPAVHANRVTNGVNGSRHADKVRDALRLRNALKSELAHGPRPIGKLVAGLKRAGLVKDVTPEVRAEVKKFLSTDKTFSIRATGIYALRSRSV